MSAPRLSICKSLPIFLLASLLAVIMVGCGGKSTLPPSPAPGEGEAAAGHPKASDLDQPVDRLMAAVCEHEIPQHTCDECRYQVGVVKVPDALFDAVKGGTLRTMTLGTKSLAASKDLNGEIRLNEERAVNMSPRAAGVVRSIRVDLGSKVAQGQVLFDVDSPGFRQAKADYVRAQAAMDLARATERRESDLFSRGICPKKDLLEAQAALRGAQAQQRAAAGELLSMGLSASALEDLAAGGNASGLMPVCAPFPGVVLERSLSLGAQVQPGDKALLLADTSKVWVIATLYEGEVAAVLAAQGRQPVEAEVRVAAYPGKTFKGRIERIGGTLDETTRAALARVVVDNADGLLRAGMFARVRLLQAGDGARLALPDEAILQDEGRAFVFVHVSGPYFMRRPVTVGRTADGWSEVEGGVKAGDTVVTTGAFLLKSDVLRSKMGAGCAD